MQTPSNLILSPEEILLKIFNKRCSGFTKPILLGFSFSTDKKVFIYPLWILFTVYLAYDTYKAKIKSVEQRSTIERSTFAFYRDGFLVAGLSPKAVIFFGTIFLSFIDFQANYVSQFIILIITYVILDFLSFE